MVLADAIERTTQPGGWLIVHATSGSSKDCDMMDRTTLREPDVVNWIEANALAITLDVDSDRERAKPLKILTVPTLIAFKGGVERERLRGFRGSSEVHTWLNGLERDQVDAGELPVGKGEDVGARSEIAKALLCSGRYEEATEDHVWLWNNMALASDYEGVRESYLAGEINSLVCAWTPAYERFAEIRDKVAAALHAGPELPEWRLEWVVLNSVLGDDERTMAWVDTLKGDSSALPILRSGGRHLIRPLKLRGRWADMGRLYIDPLKELASLHEFAILAAQPLPDLLPNDLSANFGDVVTSQFRTDAADLCMSLRAAGRTKEAKEVQAAAVRLDPSNEMKMALERVSTRYN